MIIGKFAPSDAVVWFLNSYYSLESTVHIYIVHWVCNHKRTFAVTTINTTNRLAR